MAEFIWCSQVNILYSDTDVRIEVQEATYIDATSNDQQDLFCQKLQQCCVLFDFLDSVSDLRSKEIKRATLNELVEYVSTNRGVIVESAYCDIVKMVCVLTYLSVLEQYLDWHSQLPLEAVWSQLTYASLVIAGLVIQPTGGKSSTPLPPTSCPPPAGPSSGRRLALRQLQLWHLRNGEALAQQERGRGLRTLSPLTFALVEAGGCQRGPARRQESASSGLSMREKRDSQRPNALLFVLPHGSTRPLASAALLVRLAHLASFFRPPMVYAWDM
uniref:Uncharacterized protein n=1 Tax=Sphaerodactylus townsendi TaxID=933632 RepID=A0ACB8GB22_9SAUR